MEPLISIPREALAHLLKAAGSPLTPEAYVASLATEKLFWRYPSRARASAWSKNILAVAAVLSVFLLPVDLSLEAVVITVILLAITFFEYRVNLYFRELNPKAPDLGFRNQSVFAAVILVYGLYHFFAESMMPIPIEYNNLIDPETMNFLRFTERISYLIIGIVGGLSQFGLAWYYRAARVPAEV